MAEPTDGGQAAEPGPGAARDAAAEPEKRATRADVGDWKTQKRPTTGGFGGLPGVAGAHAADPASVDGDHPRREAPRPPVHDAPGWGVPNAPRSGGSEPTGAGATADASRAVGAPAYGPPGAGARANGTAPAAGPYGSGPYGNGPYASGPYEGSPYGAGGPGWSGQPPATDPGARKALIGAIVSVFCFGILVGPASIIEGVRARKRIRESQGTLTGDSMALAGVILGSCTTAINVVAIAMVAIAAISAPKTPRYAPILPPRATVSSYPSVPTTSRNGTVPSPAGGPSSEQGAPAFPVTVSGSGYSLKFPSKPIDSNVVPELDGLSGVGRSESTADGVTYGLIDGVIISSESVPRDQLLKAATARVTDRVVTESDSTGTFQARPSFDVSATLTNPEGGMVSTAFTTTNHLFVIYVIAPTPDVQALQAFSSTFAR